MKLNDVDLSALAHSIIADKRSAEPDRDVEVLISDNLETSGDTRLMRLLLENLLDNAWKFTARTANPRIEFGSLPANGRSAFYVRDNGVGFDPAYADKLFGVFQRLHTVEEFPGVGIGLATVQRIVQRHGGRVWAESTPGRGATFFFSL
jgi:light-regulated signal transduction histidine kinase (bacteriophytochrome)